MASSRRQREEQEWPNILLPNGDTILLDAVRTEPNDPRSGSVSGGIESLLKSGANTATTNTNTRMFPLNLAVALRNPAMTKLLLKYKANPNQTHKDTGLAPAHIAAGEGNNEVLDLLIRYKVNLLAQDKNEKTAMFFAAKNGHAGNILVQQLHHVLTYCTLKTSSTFFSAKGYL